MAEADLQRRLFQELGDYSDPRIPFIYAVPNGRFRNIKTAKLLKLEGSKAGVSDVCLPIRGVEGEPGAYLEMKYGYGTLTVEQGKFIAFVKTQGYVTVVCYQWEHALHFILKYLGVKPKWKHRMETLIKLNPELKNVSSPSRSGESSASKVSSKRTSPSTKLIK